jgi:hypothetical protein
MVEKSRQADRRGGGFQSLSRRGGEEKNLCSCWKSKIASPIHSPVTTLSEDKLHTKNKKFWDESIAYFLSARRGPYRRRRLQQLFYHSVYILYHGNVFIEPLRRNYNVIHIQTHRIMGGGI